MVSNLDELNRLLAMLREHGVKQFNMENIQIVMEFGLEESEDDTEEVDEKTPVTQMGFETTDYKSLGVQTEFDE